jgi:signal transduction histidine kinase
VARKDAVGAVGSDEFDPAPSGEADPRPNSPADGETLQLREALREALGEVQNLRERIRMDMSERDELLTVVSHELRTPITVIAGYNKLLLSRQVGALNAEQTRFLEESTKSCQRLSTFIGNLVDVSGQVRGEAALTRGEVPLVPLVEGVVEFLRPLLERAEMRVETDLSAAAAHAYCDAGRIEQVLTNLINNAMNHARSGRFIRIESRRLLGDEGDAIEISVEDRGAGVSAVDRQRIFDPYVRLSRDDVSGGLGLGLAICRRIVEAHGGEISVTEREGGGSRFVFYLPTASESRTQGDR